MAVALLELRAAPRGFRAAALGADFADFAGRDLPVDLVAALEADAFFDAAVDFDFAACFFELFFAGVRVELAG